MAPIVGLGIAAGLGYLGWKKFGKPNPANYQTQNVIAAGGVPVQIVTPIPAFVTPGQAQAIATPPAPSPAPHIVAPAVAQVVPGQGTVYAPPKMVDVSSAGSFQMAPIIVSPTGSSSVAIGSVKDIQNALNTLGFKPALVADGKLGPATIANIRAFQGKAGLVVDGNAGPATKAGLSNALAQFVSGGSTAKIAAAATQAVANKTHSTINTMRDVQHGLNLLGAKPGLQEDGVTGPKTVAAIKSFQMSHGLTVDGVAGPKTKQAIGIAIDANPIVPNMAGQFGFGGGFG
jgi:peptidoglycan hydrolase-like protein with peptidoglycan-binding domain